MKNIEQTLTSTEVAGMVKKQHKDLIRDIKRYIRQMYRANEEYGGERNLAPTDFFRESTYLSEQNKKLPCYNITKKGCEFIANKLTGTKGTEFTACYVNRFHEMKTQLETETSWDLLICLREKLEKQEIALHNIERQTKRKGYISQKRIDTVQEQYRQEIEQMVESSCDMQYLRAIYTFAKHYPNKSIGA